MDAMRVEMNALEVDNLRLQSNLRDGVMRGVDSKSRGKLQSEERFRPHTGALKTPTAQSISPEHAMCINYLWRTE